MINDASNSGGSSTSRTTVIITAHNYGRYLAQCIDSVLGQSRQPARLVVLDDASEDNTADVLLSYAPQIDYHRVEFRNSQRTRNFGLTRATTEYVLFLDADDYLERTAIERLEDALDREPAARVAYCDKHVFGDAAAMNRLRLEPIWRAPEFSLETLRFRNFIMLTSLVRRAHVDAFDERIRRLQDWELWLGMLRDESHAIHVPEALLHYRVHGENISIRQRELIERLKILVKHGLIGAEGLAPEPGAAGKEARRRTVVVLTLGAPHAELAPWQELAQRHGWKVRAIVGVPQVASGAAADREGIVRAGDVVLQTTASADIEDLFRRYSGVITDPLVNAVIVTADPRSISAHVSPFGGAQRALRCERSVEGLLSTKALEELGTFALSPAAARLLLYLPPAARPTLLVRLRRAATELVSQHLGWRFRRPATTNHRQGH